MLLFLNIFSFISHIFHTLSIFFSSTGNNFRQLNCIIQKSIIFVHPEINNYA
jgi:hypothetical protein